MLEINAQLTSLFEFEKDPTKCILERIEKNKNITIKDFQVTMEQMDRWDIISDTQKMFGMHCQKITHILVVICTNFAKMISKFIITIIN